MKKVLLMVLACLPLMVVAQGVWERPQAEQQPTEKEVKEAKRQAVKMEDMRYLSGTVPEVNGKIVFALDVDVPGKSAQDIYDIVYAKLDSMTKESNQLPESMIALVNKRDHIIAARFNEWLVFSSNFISLDRTEFDYTVIATCTDRHLHMTLERMSYNYGEGTSTGFRLPAEKLISDKAALNKSKTKLLLGSAKFRRGTIDRKDDIFKAITQALK